MEIRVYSIPHDTPESIYSIPHDTPESIPFDTETILFTALYASPIQGWSELE